MNLREAMLWQAGPMGRLGVILVCVASIVLLAYLHTILGLTYEFYVFFAPPVAVVAWFSGRIAGYGVAIITTGLWLGADYKLESGQAGLLPMAINSVGRLLVFSVGIWILVQLRSVLDRERRLAREDALTLLPNRREFYARGRQALSQVQRDKAPITAVFIDLDKFKEVNDEEGHQAGDAVLICVAKVLNDRLRSSDVAGRLGGDEFALLLPGMEGMIAATYIDDLRRRLLTAMAARKWPVTFSIGAASYRRAPVDLDAMVAQADAVMYEVKHGGRDRILQKEL
jgi:diguanylate cyclase (GGDEF)-like protein